MPGMHKRLSLFLFFLLGYVCSGMLHAGCTREEMAEAFQMRLYLYDVSGMTDIFHERTAPFIKALERRADGLAVFPADVCYDMLAGGDGSIPLRTLGGKYTLDELLEKKIHFQRLYQKHLAQGKPVPDFFTHPGQMMDALDEFKKGRRTRSSAIDAVYCEYERAINEMEKASLSFSARSEREGKPFDRLSALRRLILRKVTYPVEAQEAGISGRVVCLLLLDEDGNIRSGEDH